MSRIGLRVALKRPDQSSPFAIHDMTPSVRAQQLVEEQNRLLYELEDALHKYRRGAGGNIVTPEEVARRIKFFTCGGIRPLPRNSSTGKELARRQKQAKDREPEQHFAYGPLAIKKPAVTKAA